MYTAKTKEPHLIGFDEMYIFCRRISKSLPANVECFEITSETDDSGYLGLCTTLVFNLLCYNCNSSQQAVKQFLASHTIVKKLADMAHRRKLKIAELEFKFEGEPEPRRIYGTASITVCEGDVA